MGRLVLALAALLTTAFIQVERGVEDPRTFVAGHFAHYRGQASEPIPEPSFAYSARLAALFEAYETWARAHDDLVGSLDFDWWVNAQDWDISNLSIIEFRLGADRRVIEAHWRNSGRADSSRFLFVREGESWVLDDVVNGSGRGDDGWTLSALLAERPE